MSGSNNSQLIIPHQTKDLNFTVPQTTVIPENTPVIENHENTHEIWIPESTRVLLNKVIQELSMYVPQDQLGDIAIILSQIFNNIDSVKVKKKGDSKKRVEYIVREYLDAMTIEGKSHNTLNYYRQHGGNCMGAGENTSKMGLYYRITHIRSRYIRNKAQLSMLNLLGYGSVFKYILYKIKYQQRIKSGRY